MMILMISLSRSFEQLEDHLGVHGEDTVLKGKPEVAPKQGGYVKRVLQNAQIISRISDGDSLDRNYVHLKSEEL